MANHARMMALRGWKTCVRAVTDGIQLDTIITHIPITNISRHLHGPPHQPGPCAHVLEAHTPTRLVDYSHGAVEMTASFALARDDQQGPSTLSARSTPLDNGPDFVHISLTISHIPLSVLVLPLWVFSIFYSSRNESSYAPLIIFAI